MPRGIVLVSAEPSTVDAVGQALSTNGRLTSENICCSLPELAARLEQQPAPAALVDLDPDPSGILASLDPIISRHDQTRFIVLSSSQQSDLLLAAMQAGARHFILKQAIPQQLGDVLRRLDTAGGPHRGGRDGTPRGRVITFLSAGGGCGATTLAVNLAHELHLHTRRSVLLVDMDASYGAVAGYLGIDSRFGLADVLAYAGRVDQELVRSTAQQFGDSMAVLLSPASTNPLEPAPLDLSRIGDALEVFRETYSYVVLDAPRLAPDAAARLASASEATLVTMQLTVKDIRTASTLIAGLARRGVSGAGVMPLVNRYRWRGPLVALDEASRALGGVPLVCCRNDFRSAARAVNVGQPLEQAAPRSALRKDVARLAAKLAQSEAPAPPTPAATPHATQVTP